MLVFFVLGGFVRQKTPDFCRHEFFNDFFLVGRLSRFALAKFQPLARLRRCAVNRFSFFGKIALERAKGREPLKIRRAGIFPLFGLSSS